MIVEHEVITFVADEPRSLAAVHGLIAELGRPEPMEVVRGLVRAGWVELCDPEGSALANWESAEVLRSCGARNDVFVLSTRAGLEWGYS